MPTYPHHLTPPPTHPANPITLTLTQPNFLLATLGHFYQSGDGRGGGGWTLKPKAAFVQTPQDFYNLDAVDRLGHAARFFYGPMLQGRDGVGGCPCVGTGVVFRRDILMSMAGRRARSRRTTTRRCSSWATGLDDVPERAPRLRPRADQPRGRARAAAAGRWAAADLLPHEPVHVRRPHHPADAALRLVGPAVLDVPPSSSSCSSPVVHDHAHPAVRGAALGVHPLLLYADVPKRAMLFLLNTARNELDLQAGWTYSST